MTLYEHSTVYTGDDVRINGVTLNTIAEDSCKWILTGLDGSWGLPSVEVPEDPRPFNEEGSYMTRGRYGVRNITMTGYIVPGAENPSGVPFTVAARNSLNRALQLVRKTGTLEVDEIDETKAAAVQTVGRPLTRFNGMNDVLEFNVQLVASDPRKYAAYQDTASVSLPLAGTGRKYYRTYNWAYFIPGDPSELNAINRGSYNTNGTAVIYGPVLNPTLEHIEQGITLGFNVNLGPADTLTLDFSKRTAQLSSGLSAKNSLMAGTDWFTLQPGDNHIRFGGTQTITPQNYSPAATNLALNPSLEATTGTAVVRTNAATTPNGNTYVTATGATLGWTNSRWFGGGSATGTYTSVTGATDGPLPNITAYARKTWTNVTGGGQGDTGFGSNTWTGVLADTVYTVSGWMRPSVARSNVGWDVSFNDGTGQIQRSSQSSFNAPAGVWTRFTGTFTSPVTGAVSMAFVFDTDSGVAWAVGSTLDVTGLLVERIGTVGALQRTNLHTNPELGRNSTNWAVQGGAGTWTTTRETTMGTTTGSLPFGAATPWFKMTATVAPTASPIGVNSSGFTVATGASPVTPGQSYMIAGYYVTSENAATSLRLEANWCDAGGAVLSTTNTTLTANTPLAWQRLISGVLTAPAGAVAVRLALRQNLGTFPVGGFIGATCVQIEQATSLSSYFDGSTVGGTVTEYTWSGTPYNSPSLMRNAATGPVNNYFDGGVQPALRINWIPNPSFETNTSSWALSGSLLSVARDTTWDDTGVASCKVISAAGTSVSTSGDLRLTTGGATSFPAGVGPGRTYTMSAVINSPAALTGFNSAAASRQNRILYFYSTNGSTFNEAFGPQGPNVPGVQTLTHTFTVPTNATGVILAIGCAGSPTDQSYVTYVDSIMLEEAASTTYFDGSTTQPAGFSAAWYGTANNSASYIYDADLTPSWTGTANASTSVVSGVGVANLGPGGSTTSARISSAQWADTRSKSIRIIPTGSSVDSYVELATNSSGGLPNTAGIAGKTYTILATARLTGALQGATNSYARSLVAIHNTTGGTIVQQSTPVPNSAGVYQAQLIVNVPTNIISTSIRAYNGASLGNGEIWWDSIMIVEGEYFYSYFDGTYPYAVWNGTADASSSTRPELAQVNLAMVQLTYTSAWIE